MHPIFPALSSHIKLIPNILILIFILFVNFNILYRQNQIHRMKQIIFILT
jgi:hypothetical protein